MPERPSWSADNPESRGASNKALMPLEDRQIAAFQPQPEAPALPEAGDRVGAGPLIVVGFVIMGLFFGVGLLWAGLAPLSSAAIAQGVVSVSSNRKTVQHLEGGIVREILVREGQQVSAGQTLLELDPTQAAARFAPLRSRYLAALSLEARLGAERYELEAVDFPPELLDEGQDPEVQQAIVGQIDIFESRREALQKRLEIMRQQIAQLGEEIKGYEGEIVYQDQQLALIDEELVGLRSLAEKGLLRR